MNLLANPGFEVIAADQPERWDHFVQPKPGAVARLDNQSRSGDYSVWLHTPTPYDREPVNNWSQNVIANFGGETLRLTGHIRVAEAKEAAIWIQCWRKRPWGVMSSASTSTDTPVYGTADWQEVSMDVPVPAGTDFITVRCVLLGTGSAWFDDLSLTRVSGKSAPKTAAVKGEAPPAEERPSGAAETGDAPNAAEVAKPPAPNGEAEEQQDAVLPLMNQLEAEVRRLRDANLLLADTLEQIQAVNQGLVDEMMAVQAEVRAMKEEDGIASAPPLKTEPPRVPPLIPLSEAMESESP